MPGRGFEANGETGSTGRLRDTAAKTPRPVELTVRSNAAAFSAEGQSRTPLQPASFSGGWPLTDLAQLQPFVPHVPLPSVQGYVATHEPDPETTRAGNSGLMDDFRR
ncbi:MAG: hypothetical protein WA864_23425 [Acetobacteraceae bacterium]|jgi:hypothetical protein